MSLIKGCPEIESAELFYEKADQYWRSISATLNGMLGGYGHVSNIDISGSEIFLKKCFKGKDMAGGRAMDCGSGIGRVAKYLLLPLFAVVDLAEMNPDFLTQAREFIGSSASRVGHYYPCTLQNLVFEEKYDVIWVQWVTGHLTDDDFVRFLQRARDALTRDGVVVVKDNVASGECDHDARDSSVTRSRELLHDIYRRAGMRILDEQRQRNFPPELYNVTMTALTADAESADS